MKIAIVDDISEERTLLRNRLEAQFSRRNVHRLDNGSNVPVSRKLLKNAKQTFMDFLFQRRS